MACFHPILVKNCRGEPVTVACGKCVGCLKKRKDQWTIRLRKEQEMADSTYFITLTYDDESVFKDSYGLKQLVKRDLQLFFKRLRKAANYKVRYYAIGEYGGKSLRPHYHAILFIYGEHLSVDMIKKDVKNAWSYFGQPIGLIDCEPAKEGSLNYVSGYVMSKNDVNNWFEPCFALMSIKPAIGSGYISDRIIEYHNGKSSDLMVIEGFKHKMPRYYKEKIFNDLKKAVINRNTKIYLDKKEKEIEEKDLKNGEGFSVHLQRMEQKEKTVKKQITKRKKL